MNGKLNPELTFDQIAEAVGKKQDNSFDHSSVDDYPLATWYNSIRNKPLKDFTVEDMCKACRQLIHIDYVVPVALEWLSNDPLAGELYEGELLVALKSIPKDYWIGNPSAASALKKIVSSISDELDEDVKHDVDQLLTTL